MKFLDLKKEYLKKLREKHEIMIQKERLTALGRMIGGIAHNLKTPIVSIVGGTEALKDLINEYRESVEDLSLTQADHKEIAEEMFDWVKEIRSHCAYMSDIISAVTEQAAQMNYPSGYSFTLESLLKRIDILMKYELKKYNCVLNIDVQVDREAEIQGGLNNLAQVFNNLILNAIQAYDGQGGKIDFNITRNQNGDLEFEVKDYGKGISQEVGKRLFKEMFTTKGAKGTGIGLFMSYLTIKHKFGGTIRFESEEGKGTVFYITVPTIDSRAGAEVS
jgi:two-component system NtrC family sensor kinase